MPKEISSLNVALGATVAPFVSAFKGAGSSLTSFASSVTSAGATLVKFTGLAAGVGAIVGVFGSLRDSISLAAELEQTSVAFETMLGSGEAAAAMMKGLTDLAASTPFEFPEIAASAKKLLAFGVAASDINAKISSLGDIAAGTGKPLGELAAIYGKIKSRGQLTGETLNQLAEAGVPIYAALAKSLHTTESAVAGLVTAGKVGFPQVDAALRTLTATGGRFSGLMEKQSHTLGGVWSNLTDNASMGLAGLVKTIFDAFSITSAVSRLADSAGRAAAVLQGFVARTAPMIVAWGAKVYDTASGAWSRLAAFVGPTLGRIRVAIVDNFAAGVAAVRSIASAVTESAAPFTKLAATIGGVFLSAVSSAGSALRQQIPTLDTARTIARGLTVAVGSLAVGYVAWQAATLATTAAQYALNAGMLVWAGTAATVNAITGGIVTIQGALLAAYTAGKAAVLGNAAVEGTLAAVRSAASTATIAYTLATASLTAGRIAAAVPTLALGAAEGVLTAAFAVGRVGVTAYAALTSGLLGVRVTSTAITAAASAAEWILNAAVVAGNAVRWAGVAAYTATKGAILGFNIATAALTSVQWAWRTVTMTATAAQWLLTAALTANPIGIVVVAVGALVAGLAYAATRFVSLSAIVAGAKTAFDMSAYAIENWKATLKLGAVAAGYEIVKLGNQIAYVFSDVIPATLTWFGNNWRDVLKTVSSYLGAVFTNMLKNAEAFGKALWEAVKGNGFKFEFTALTEGFENSLKTMPEIAARQIGATEAALGKNLDSLTAKFQDGFKKYQDAQKKAAEAPSAALASTGGILRAIANAVKKAQANIKPPDVGAFVMPDIPAPDVSGPVAALDSIKSAADGAREALGMLVSGSAESQLALYKSTLKFATPAAPTASGQAGGILGGVARAVGNRNELAAPTGGFGPNGYQLPKSPISFAPTPVPVARPVITLPAPATNIPKTTVTATPALPTDRARNESFAQLPAGLTKDMQASATEAADTKAMLAVMRALLIKASGIELNTKSQPSLAVANF